ncbi:monodehydroascorbate reductase (NADH) [Fistulifera solaris]|uniref:Monodehydroascorbate reductase (NADH) n=1 Tax=Fistulifera solaris TaxID=1519565 RepID=A0A1Z5J938_FISSO|nr:monodehydroascorbate reductase (NADH) [Fistulifera solaris]|eukprot:GAX10281.1 monodehydroascorbate reductase (NADH) [Fistulifera solaris]
MKIVIVGGVAGGASAAARARRLSEKAEILLLQSGPDISFASCGMPYFIGNEITDRKSMAVQTPESLRRTLNIEVRVLSTVTDIKTDEKTITVRDDAKGDVYTKAYDHLILAVGAAPFKPPIPGIERPGLFSLRNLQDMDQIYAWIEKKQKELGEGDMRCVVAGAGFIGLEMVEQLVHRNMNVTLVEAMPQIMGPMDVEMAAILHSDLEAHGVDVIVNDPIASFAEAPKDPESSILTLKSGKVLPAAQLTILGLGVRPDTDVIKQAGIEVTPRGHIVVDETLHTSASNVWAVGDAVEITNPILGEKWAVPLAGPANRQGRMVADNIFLETKRKYKGTWRVSIVRSFELYAACVGLNDKLLKAKGLPYSVVHIHPNDHAGYYPGAEKVHLKLIFDPMLGKIYGAQIVGKAGVDKRIDVIATAMQGNLKVEDLAELELSYAPPTGSAKDAVNYAGMAAQNTVEGLVSQVQWTELETLASDPSTVILDVCNPGEIEGNGPLVPTALNIPLGELRSQLNEVPRDKKLVVSCASGQRAYYACCILKQNGFPDVQNLAGAFMTTSFARQTAA